MAEQTQPLNLRQKLVQVYRKIDHIEKAGTNSKQNYKFVRSADVLRAVRAAFSELGIYPETNYELLGTYDIKTNSGGVMHTATVKATIVLHDVDSNETKTISGLGDGADSGDKGVYKAQTGATKNALRNSFLIPDEADPEADASVDEAVQEQRQRTAPTAKAEIPKDSAIAAVGNPVIASGGHLPDDAQYESYLARLKNMREKLQTEGKLKPSAGLPAARKMLNYIKKVTGQDDLKQVTTVQFDAFFQFAEKMDTESLVKLINDININTGGK